MDLHNLCMTGDIHKLDTYLNNISSETPLLGIDQNGRTSLHCAAAFNGNDSEAVECIQLILKALEKIWSGQCLNERQQEVKLLQLLEIKDTRQHTALYYAVKNKHLLVCELLLNVGADWDSRDSRGKPIVMKVYKRLPGLLHNLLSRATFDCAHYTDLERNCVSIDFGFIIGHPTDEEILSKSNSIYEEMKFLSNIIYTPLASRWLILNQPLIKLFIFLKWRNARTYFWVARFFHITWYTMYFIFLVSVYRQGCPYNSTYHYNFTWFYGGPKEASTDLKANRNECKISPLAQVFSWIILVIGLFESLIFEILPLTARRRRLWYSLKTNRSTWKYKRSLKFLFTTVFCNIMRPAKWIFLITVFISIGPILLPKKRLHFEDWQYVTASVGVALAWYQILLQIGKISRLKVYIKMLQQVLTNICVVLLLYLSLIVAFAMIFCVLLPGVPAFSSLYEALLKMSTFFIGEVDYDDTFYSQNEKYTTISPSFCTAILFYGVGVVILHLALFNFLISLTEVNVKEISSYSDIWANYNYIRQISLIETFLASPTPPRFPILGQMKLRILKSLMLFDYKCYDQLSGAEAENTGNTLVKEIRMNDLNKQIRQEIRDLDLRVAEEVSTQIIRA